MSHPLHQIQILIFDFDGTLADSIQVNTELFAGILFREFGISRAQASAYFRQTAGAPMTARFKEGVQLFSGVTLRDTERLEEEFFRGVEKAPCILLDDALPALQRLRQASYKIAISSANRPAILGRKLDSSGLLPLVDIYLGLDPDKPLIRKGPGHFGRIAQEFGLREEELARRSLFIGDGVHDMQTARAAGIPAVGRTTTLGTEALLQAGASYVIADLHQLLGLLFNIPPAG